MARFRLPALALIVAGVCVAAGAWSNSRTQPSVEAELQPTALSASTKEKILYGSDGSTSLPVSVKIGTTSGVITTVVTSEKNSTPGDWSDLLGTRYTKGTLDGTDVTRQLWRTVSLLLTKPDGSTANIQIARPLWWFEDIPHEIGSKIDLEMHEVGIVGEATVLNIGPFDAATSEDPPNSSIVIGTIEHENAIVLDLIFNNQDDQPLGVTASHPIYSDDRDDWVPAGDLRVGENVVCAEGVATLTGRTKRPGLHKVYNLEVHRAHSYHVSELGILAHNTGIWTCGKAGSPAKNAFGHYKKHGSEFPRNPERHTVRTDCKEIRCVTPSRSFDKDKGQWRPPSV